MNSKDLRTTIDVSFNPWKLWDDEKVVEWYRYMVRINEKDLAESLGLEAFERGLI